jgi:hypothetical protein
MQTDDCMQNMPLEITRTQTPKKIDSIYSFPGYDVCSSSHSTLFQYKPSSSLSASSSGENVAMKDIRAGQHHHTHHHHHHHHHHDTHRDHSHHSSPGLKPRNVLSENPQEDDERCGRQRTLKPRNILSENPAQPHEDEERRGRQRTREVLQPPPTPVDVEMDPHDSDLWLDGTITRNQTRPTSPSSQGTVLSNYPESLDFDDICGHGGRNSPNLDYLDGEYCIVEGPKSPGERNAFLKGARTCRCDARDGWVMVS